MKIQSLCKGTKMSCQLVMPNTTSSDSRTNREREMNILSAEVRKEFGGVDTSVNTMRLKALRGNIPHPEAEAEGQRRRDAAAARANAPRPKTPQEVIAELEARVKVLEAEVL